MYELIKINENDYYIDSPSASGVVKISENEVILIDAGNDRSAGKKIKKTLDGMGWTLNAIYVTHAHADHIGGAKYLVEQTGCKVYAKGAERAFTEHTLLEGAFLYGGYAPSELRRKFLLAEQCPAEYLTEQNIHPKLSMKELNGHCFEMVGFLTESGTFYIADAISSEQTIDKYKVGFIYDVAEYIKTLEMLKTADAKVFVPAHAPVTENITDLLQYNINATMQICEKLIKICEKPLCFEQILKELFDSYELTMTFEQYALVGSTVRSYLAYLKEEGKIKATVENNLILWSKKQPGE